LIPRRRYTRETGYIDGYDVINPIYCYEGAKFSFKNLFDKKDPVNLERSALILNRGWIPEDLKDKRSRPNEINTRKL
jgi:hypothetical protein